ncbi:pyridoxamine 5'-phosphate oxidase family protein [Phenylobacterium montanum]|uniref:Pyridoxamine 5'-phosphate oxidase family protein n=1 Tax=Phenylobacterium montanum TaxID=2823693 RepID=A0A975FYM3_9CAUL|nr:pyridoxamine 5'-phosphate oxidase family protein [Caulobacter sp. S6]QUD86711.1 pyridoxamine 5'-phosphate oxidase family protein [Caulobacter sp. S6]
MDLSASPWHAGELAVQARFGVVERMDPVGRMALRPFMPDQHRAFFAQLPFVLVGSADATGQVWASLLAGPPGFIDSPDPVTLAVRARPIAGDPLAEALRPGAALGLLGIELPTRRRNRANGRVVAAGEEGFVLHVEQSFGNCPKYIARRDYRPVEAAAPSAVEPVTRIGAAERRLIGAADALFIASSPGEGQLPDVSHRGGRPGFVAIGDDGALVVPEYVGNSFFNTLGNLTLDPRAGLLVPDFATGDLLQLTGRVQLDFDPARVAALPGAQLAWRFHPTAGRWVRAALPLRFGEAEASPFSPG